MTYLPTQAGFMQLQDSALLLRVVFPNYPELQPCYPVPVLEVAGSISRVGLYAVMKKATMLASLCETTKLLLGISAGRRSVILDKHRSAL
jgi:hypothetical protein